MRHRLSVRSVPEAGSAWCRSRGPDPPVDDPLAVGRVQDGRTRLPQHVPTNTLRPCDLQPRAGTAPARSGGRRALRSRTRGRPASPQGTPGPHGAAGQRASAERRARDRSAQPVRRHDRAARLRRLRRTRRRRGSRRARCGRQARDRHPARRARGPGAPSTPRPPARHRRNGCHPRPLPSRCGDARWGVSRRARPHQRDPAHSRSRNAGTPWPASHRPATADHTDLGTERSGQGNRMGPGRTRPDARYGPRAPLPGLRPDPSAGRCTGWPTRAA
jgi:hypothetical protein